MLDDEQILERGGSEEDIANYAHDVGGACGAIYGGTCEHCGKTDDREKRYFYHGASDILFYIFEGDEEPRNDGELDEISLESFEKLISDGIQNDGYFYR